MPANPTRASDSKPLPLEDTLHDLAILRASDIDLSKCIPEASGPKVLAALSEASSQLSGDVKNGQDEVLAQSYEYVKECRAAIRLLHRGSVDVQGGRADDIRGTLEDVLVGLEGQ